MSDQDTRALWDRWISLWNGDLALADDIIHAEFVLHRSPPPQLPEGRTGRDALVAWIEQTRSLFPDLHFTVEVGPVVEGGTVAGHWIAEGTYQGGVPGSTAPAGTRIRFGGTDMWRSEDGRVREYWLSDDLLDLLQQLGVVGGPA